MLVASSRITVLSSIHAFLSSLGDSFLISYQLDPGLTTHVGFSGPLILRSFSPFFNEPSSFPMFSSYAIMSVHLFIDLHHVSQCVINTHMFSIPDFALFMLYEFAAFFFFPYSSAFIDFRRYKDSMQRLFSFMFQHVSTVFRMFDIFIAVSS